MNTKIFKSLLLLCCLSAFFLFGCTQNDSEIQSQVNEKLAADPDLSGVSAAVNAGEVTLSGQVASEETSQKAAEAAKEVKGVRSVVNNTTVYTPPPPPPPTAPVIDNDSTLTTGVVDATKDFPGVTATVNDGEITLTGKIKKDDLDRLMQSLNSLRAAKFLMNSKLNNHGFTG